MEVSFIYNQQQPLETVINTYLPSSQTTSFAVAFMKFSGYQMIEDALDTCLENGGYVNFIVGLDFHTTDAKSLQALYSKNQENKFEFSCFSSYNEGAPSFHPKLYLFSNQESNQAIIGSSNLTRGGLKNNVELNTLLTMTEKERAWEELVSLYLEMKSQKTNFVPDQTYIEIYSDLAPRVQKERMPRDAGLTKALEDLRAHENTLPRTRISPRDLSGWHKLVYDYLPDGVFRTSEMYQYVEVFREQYPENSRIEEKIRQILQQLRNMGLIDHISRGKWEK